MRVTRVTKWSALIALSVTGGFFACNHNPNVGGGDGDGTSMGGSGGTKGPTDNLSLGGSDSSNGSGGSGTKVPSVDLDLTVCDTQKDCPTGTLCKYDYCLPDLGSCTQNDDCPGDAYCDADDICVPYGVDPDVINDPTCKRADEPPSPVPDEQCKWTPGETDPITDIYTTPMVADLNLDGDPNKLQPSVIITTRLDVEDPEDDTKNERMGKLRIIDGRTCQEQLTIGDPNDPNDVDAPAQSAQLAIGDLDLDLDDGGRPEIVGLHRTPGAYESVRPLQPIAWQITGSGDTLALETMWRGHVCGGDNDGDPVQFGNNWLEFGPALYDLNNDGVPEVVIDKYVLDNKGCILNKSVNDAADGGVQAAVDALYTPYLTSGNNHKGAFSAVADVDLDGKPELVRFDGIYAWTNNEWVKESYVTNWTGDSAKPGHVAIANMGAYSAITGHPATDALPEIIVVSAEGNFDTTSTGSVRVMKLDGSVVYERDIPHQLTDCGGNPDPCYGGHGGPPTASDFDGDGQVEFAAAANVYYTVYDPDCVSTGVPAERSGGKCDNSANPLPPDGQKDGILWARESEDFSSSQTGSSIFDFDGDGTAEAVYRDENSLYVFSGTNGDVVFSGPATSGTGSEYPTIADVDGDFATEIIYGNKDGLTILKEPDDLWVSSRPIWNQHAYSITHVTDAGKIQKTSAWKNNWETTGLNNFRQNTQGELGALSLADLTVELDQIEAVCNGSTSKIPLYAKVCNRGTNPVQDGAEVAFFSKPQDAAPSDPGTKLCDAVTETLLGVGMCTIVTCQATVPSKTDVFVLVDPDGKIPDCHPGNNDGSGSSVLCPAVR